MTSKKFLTLCAFVLSTAVSIHGQGTIDKHGAYHSTDKEIAISQHLLELLRHPTFITLRLLASPRDVPRENLTDTPSPYKVKDWISFQLFITQNSTEAITFWSSVDPYYQSRPELMRDGESVPYSKKAQVEIVEPQLPSGSGAPITLEPGREHPSNYVNLDDWYDPLTPGFYQLRVRKRFAWDGDWVTSTPIYFEVQLRTPAPIPDGVTVEMVPDGAEPRTDGKLFRLGIDDSIAIVVRNTTGQPLKVNVVDLYYGNRPQLFKDDVLIPYRQETERLIRSKDENPRFVELGHDLYVDPGTRAALQGLTLKQWYGTLKPGRYRLINRRRFDIDGPWTADSAPLLFEVLPANKK